MNRPTVYIGWDPNETDAYAVAEHSLRRRSSVPLAVVPLKLGEPPVSGVLTRPVERRDGRLWCPISEAPMSTEFAISRFVVPFIQYEGWALFCDCDVLFTGDVAKLFALADDRYAVMVVKHEFGTHGLPKTKMNGQIQTAYPRKLWSSVVLWNCAHPAHARLSLTALNQWTGRALHAFRWLKDGEIGELPVWWNFLAEMNSLESCDNPCPKIIHYTLGTPNLPGRHDCHCARPWWEEWRKLRRNDGTADARTDSGQVQGA